VGLVEEAYINAVLTEELFQFQLPAANTVGVAACQPHGFTGALLGRAAMLSQEKNNGLEDGSGASVPCREGSGRGEQTACQLYAGRCRKVVEEVGDPLEW
jgi:hypothetical protein